MKLDILDILIPFIKITERYDVDMFEFKNYVQPTKDNLKLLCENEGENYENLKKW